MVSRTISASLYDTGLPGPFRRRDGCAAFLEFPAFARTRLIRKTIPSQSEALTRLNHPLFHSLGLHIHGWESRSWRHLDTCGFATVIRAEVPRVKDEKGQTETVSVPWAEKFSRFTRSFEAFGVEVLRAARSLSDACELLSISWDQAHRIMERAVARGLERRSLEELEAVGIDEKSFLSGQSYVSVLSDPKGSRVLKSPKVGNEPVPSDFSKA